MEDSTARRSKSSRNRNTSTTRATSSLSHDDKTNIIHSDDELGTSDQYEADADADPSMNFSQQPKLELSQSIPKPRDNERAKLLKLNSHTCDRAILDLSRLLIFKAFSGEPIERLKCISEALSEFKEERVGNAVFEKAQERLRDIFGFELCSVPDYMKGSLPGKYTDRYYVINRVMDETGMHSKAVHDNECVLSEKALLMVILAFAFCKGSPSKEGGDYSTRWISDEDLYRLLNSVDHNITEEPPRISTVSRKRRHEGGGSNDSLDVDFLLEKFLKMDYLWHRVQDNSGEGGGKVIFFAMGPRAALEIGRRQLVYFCADILGEKPDSTMLAEIDDELEEKDQSEGEGEGDD